MPLLSVGQGSGLNSKGLVEGYESRVKLMEIDCSIYLH